MIQRIRADASNDNTAVTAKEAASGWTALRAATTEASGADVQADTVLRIVLGREDFVTRGEAFTVFHWLMTRPGPDSKYVPDQNAVAEVRAILAESALPEIEPEAEADDES